MVMNESTLNPQMTLGKPADSSLASFKKFLNAEDEMDSSGKNNMPLQKQDDEMSKMARMLGMGQVSSNDLRFSLEDILREFQKQRELIESQKQTIERLEREREAGVSKERMMEIERTKNDPEYTAALNKSSDE
jgi:hypothetical protein